MAPIKPEYQVIEEFNDLATQIVEKYPDIFYGIDVDKIRCVAITNKNRPEKKDKLWDTKGVPMPILMDCPYEYYVTVFSNDWEEMDKKHRLLLICEVLNGIEVTEDGKVVPMDSKGYKIMFRTFKSIDYLQEANIPDILEENIDWITSNDVASSPKS